MLAKEIDGMFRFPIEKTVDEIKKAANEKIADLQAKIVEREGRLKNLREEYEIDDMALNQLLVASRRASQQHHGSMSYSYTSNKMVSGGPNLSEERTIGAGVVNHLLTENDFVESERDAVKQLQQMVRNLRPIDKITANGTVYKVDSFQLNADELEYLGF